MDKTRAVNAGITVKVSMSTSIIEKEGGQSKKGYGRKKQI